MSCYRFPWSARPTRPDATASSGRITLQPGPRDLDLSAMPSSQYLPLSDRRPVTFSCRRAARALLICSSGPTKRRQGAEPSTAASASVPTSAEIHAPPNVVRARRFLSSMIRNLALLVQWFRPHRFVDC
jgi:hypothetical protein